METGVVVNLAFIGCAIKSFSPRLFRGPANRNILGKTAIFHTSVLLLASLLDV
jgi:hypothetical protein